jgi:glucose-1-phosphate adenylyltransferase
VQNSIITEGTEIAGTVDFSVIFAGATVEEGAEVGYSIVMPGATIKKGACVQYAILAENCVIGEGAVIGQRPEDTPNKDEWGVCVVAGGVNIGAGAAVPAKAMQDTDIEPEPVEEVMA